MSQCLNDLQLGGESSAPRKRGICGAEVFRALPLAPTVHDTSRQQEILQAQLQPIICSKCHYITCGITSALTALGIFAA